MIHAADISSDLTKEVRKTWSWKLRAWYSQIPANAGQLMAAEIVSVWNIHTDVDAVERIVRDGVPGELSRLTEKAEHLIKRDAQRPVGIPPWLWILAIRIAVELIIRWYFYGGPSCDTPPSS